jgi:hypothetical protein
MHPADTTIILIQFDRDTSTFSDSFPKKPKNTRKSPLVEKTRINAAETRRDEPKRGQTQPTMKTIAQLSLTQIVAEISAQNFAGAMNREVKLLRLSAEI